MNTLREIAKFACGVEAFHAFFHTVLWSTGTTLTVFDVSTTPAWNCAGAIINAIVATALGVFAWGLQIPVGTENRTSRQPELKDSE